MKTLAVRAFLVTAAIAIVVTACGPARPAGGPYRVCPSSSARTAASRMNAGVGKSGSPISR